MLILILLFVVLSPGVLFTLPALIVSGKLGSAVLHSILFVVAYSLVQSIYVEEFTLASSLYAAGVSAYRAAVARMLSMRR